MESDKNVSDIQINDSQSGLEHRKSSLSGSIRSNSQVSGSIDYGEFHKVAAELLGE